MRQRKRQTITGVEIGTSTIKVVMGELLPDQVISVVGLGEAPALKVVKGEVTDANVVQEQLERALAAAEQSSGLEIGDIFLAVSGNHIHAVNSVGSTLVRSPDRRICEDDIVTAARNAHAYTLPPDKKVLHYFDRYYRIDGRREVSNPLGLVGTNLEADVHIVYGEHNRVETNCRLVADVMGYSAADVAFSGIASGLAALGPEDTEKGALLIDLGAGVTEYVVFHGPGCFHSGEVPVGCEHIVNDLSVGLRLPLPRCRKILQELDQFGSAVMTPDGRSRLMAVETLGQPPRHIPISAVEQVVELRLQELFAVILGDLRRNAALTRIGSGVQLCSGGARIASVTRLAQHAFQMPVRVAKPRLVSGREEILNAPDYMAPLGLVRWGRMMLDIDSGTSVPLWQQLRLDARRVWHMIRRSFQW